MPSASVADRATPGRWRCHLVLQWGSRDVKRLTGYLKVAAAFAFGLSLSTSGALAHSEKVVEARRLLGAHEIGGAISAMQAAVAQDTETHGADSLEVSVALSRLGLLAMARDAPDFEKGKAAYERALRIRKMRLGPYDQSVALVLEDLARLHLAEATGSPDYEKHSATARQLLERALMIRERRGMNHPYVAEALYNLATSLQNDQASGRRIVRIYQRALSIREKAFGPNSLPVAESLKILAKELGGQQGLWSNMSGDRQEAMARCRRAKPALLARKRALAIEEKRRGPDAVELTDTLRELANMDCPETGEQSDPLSLYKRILAIDEKTSGMESWEVRGDLIEMSARLSSPQQAAEKRSVDLRANRIEEAHLRDVPNKARISTRDELNSKLVAKFDEEEKLDRVEKVDDFLLYKASSHELPSRRRGDNHRWVAKTYEKLGDPVSAERVLRAFGDSLERADFLAAHDRLKEAAPEYKSTIESFEAWNTSSPSKVRRDDRQRYHHAIDGYAAILAKQQANKEAEAFLSKALDLEQSAADPDIPFLIERFDALADFYTSQERATEAERFYTKGLALADTYGPQGRPDEMRKTLVLRQLDRLIALYVRQSRLPEAEQLFKRSLSVERPGYERIKLTAGHPAVNLFGPRRPMISDRLDRYAAFQRKRGNVREADDLHKRALSIWAIELEQELRDAALFLHKGKASDRYNLKRWESLTPIYRELGDVLHEQSNAKLVSAARKRLDRLQ